MKALLTCLLVTGLLSSATDAAAARAVFAGGCFWCMEADFEKLEGVTDVIAGFTGGTTQDPTYSGNHEGHYEAVAVTYNPEKIRYSDLLEYFWLHIDPFDDKGQFCDRGSSYLSAIFVADETEKKLAERSRMNLTKRFPNKRIFTPILTASTFYPVKGTESYHQDYYKTHSIRYKYYRWNCGRDQRLEEIWGNETTH